MGRKAKKQPQEGYRVSQSWPVALSWAKCFTLNTDIPRFLFQNFFVKPCSSGFKPTTWIRRKTISSILYPVVPTCGPAHWWLMKATPSSLQRSAATCGWSMKPWSSYTGARSSSVVSFSHKAWLKSRQWKRMSVYQSLGRPPKDTRKEGQFPKTIGWVSPYSKKTLKWWGY